MRHDTQEERDACGECRNLTEELQDRQAALAAQALKLRLLTPGGNQKEKQATEDRRARGARAKRRRKAKRDRRRNRR